MKRYEYTRHYIPPTGEENYIRAMNSFGLIGWEAIHLERTVSGGLQVTFIRDITGTYNVPIEELDYNPISEVNTTGTIVGIDKAVDGKDISASITVEQIEGENTVTVEEYDVIIDKGKTIDQ